MCLLIVVKRVSGRVELAKHLLGGATEQVKLAAAKLDALDETIPDVSRQAHALHAAFDTLADETNRDFYDRPCTFPYFTGACNLKPAGRPIFGACCVRDAPDGGMRITCGSGGS